MPPFRRMLWRKRTLFWAAVLAASALLLSNLPLFNILGYEFSFIFALLGSFTGVHLGSRVVTLTRDADESLLLGTLPAAVVLAKIVVRSVLVVWLLLLPPLLIITANALRVRNCNLIGGLAFFAIMPLLSSAIATIVGVLSSLSLRRGLLATVAALGVVLFSLAWGVYRFYSEPPIFAYDPFAGYFPGTLYDEDIAIRWPFVFARLQQISWTGVALLIAHRHLDTTTL
ncbi:MAG: hypothetical protein KAI47_07805, partial [Deltaproteobacteria bacterium]|nr:hypothetical protein [Deltaproteobacteria bacterium]